MPLRYQLLLLSLLTLLLPWAGCRYAREMEAALRDGQEQALLASATTLASLLAAQPGMMNDDQTGRPPFNPKAGDLYAYQLSVPPLLDGYADDWGLPPQAFERLRASGTTLEVNYAAAVDEHSLYVVLDVKDQTPVAEQSNDPSGSTQARGDHVWLAFDAPNGASVSYLLATRAPGLLSARRPVASTYGERREVVEPRIQAFWQPDAEGYRLEIRLPRTMVGDHFGFEVVDVSPGAQLPTRVGTLDPATNHSTGRLLIPSSTLARELSSLLPPSTRVAVGDSQGWLLAEAGSLGAIAPDQDLAADPKPADWLIAIYRAVLEGGERLPSRTPIPGRLTGPPTENALGGKPDATWFRLSDEQRTLLAAAAPIVRDRTTVGAVLLEQSGGRLLTLRDRALTHLLNLTLLASGVAVLASLVFATLLGLRLRRLQRAAESSLSRDGRVNAVIPDVGARDELGDVARSFATLLARLNEYTEYLRTLAGKLAHELRTPLAIVRSSLENLESTRDDAAPYLRRAREGTDRLQAILIAMGAASRTEEAIRHAEHTRFDLGELVRATTRAYADTFATHRFASRAPESACDFVGAPDLIVQLLDKLVDNAVDFSPPGSLVEIVLEQEPGLLALSVYNEGPPIRDDVRARLFDSMFQQRPDAPGKPHFGLGLYIMRLIAEFHGGEVFAQNLAEGKGVRIGVRFRIAALHSGDVRRRNLQPGKA